MRRLASVLAVALVVGDLQAGATAPQDAVWESARPGRELVLPRDHASHPGHKLEWWYYTGNLDARDGRRFGYQLTFFRIGVNRQPASPSTWALRDLFMTHLAVTDVAGQRFHFVERLNRSGPEWAGASSSTYRVWNDDWEASLDGRRHRLRAAEGAIGLDLTLEESRPPALHGERGYSRKGAAEGNASYYYSLTRMTTRGTLRVNGQSIPVTGDSWMDHEFGTSFLEGGTRGWDWFSLQLEDGRDLMLYRFRNADGTIDPHSSGTIVEANGSTTGLAAADFSLDAGRMWTSEATGGRYPVEWRVRIPSLRLDLTVAAAVDQQELHMGGTTGVHYWEGAIDVKGTSPGGPVRGRGYLEMTGYAGRTMGEVLR